MPGEGGSSDGGGAPGHCPGIRFRRTRQGIRNTGEWRAEGSSLAMRKSQLRVPSSEGSPASAGPRECLEHEIKTSGEMQGEGIAHKRTFGGGPRCGGNPRGSVSVGRSWNK